MFLYGDQISEIVLREGLIEENYLSFNDDDNSVFSSISKSEFKCFSMTSQNFNYFVCMSDVEIMVFDYSHEIDIKYTSIPNANGFCTIRDLIKSGFYVGYFASTTRNSSNYIPTLEWLVSASVDDLRSSQSKCFHIKNNEVLVVDRYIKTIYDDFFHYTSVLCNEYGDTKRQLIVNDGSFDFLTSQLVKNNGFFTSVKDLRNHLFWGYGTGFEWNKDGYMSDNDLEYKESLITLENIELLEGSLVKHPSQLSKYSGILNIPNNIKDDWKKQIIKSVKDFEDYILNNPEDEVAKKSMDQFKDKGGLIFEY
jgi:hypothetical protein